MKISKLLILALFTLSLGYGCKNTVQGPERFKRVNTDLLGAYSDLSLERAIIKQHTLYPYHFVDNASALNTLGRRDLLVLAKHYKNHPGEICLRRFDTPDSLYAQREAAIRDFLRENQVNTQRVQVTDKLPAVKGTSSERVLEILNEKKASRAQSSARTSTTTPSTSRSGTKK